MRSTWVMAVLVACAGQTPPRVREPPVDPLARYQPSDAHFGPPASQSEPRPWKLGQWAVYKRTYGNTVAIETIQLAAEDGCGYWFQYAINGEGNGASWLFCVSAPPSPDDEHLTDVLWAVVERTNGRITRVLDFRHSSAHRRDFEWLVALVHASWPGHDELSHEDVITPAGTFEGSVKRSWTAGGVETTRWSHPIVMFGGVVKQITGSEERTLLTQGTSDTRSPILSATGAELTQVLTSRPEPQRVRGLRWFGISGGRDAFGNVDSVEWTDGLGIELGTQVTARVDAVFEFHLAGTAPSPLDPMLGEYMGLWLLGARWMPFGRTQGPGHRWLDRTGFYTQATIGYAELKRSDLELDYSTVGRGIGAGVTTGFAVAQARDWTVSLEVHDDMALLNADEGLRHAFGVGVALQLFVPGQSGL